MGLERAAAASSEAAAGRMALSLLGPADAPSLLGRVLELWRAT